MIQQLQLLGGRVDFLPIHDQLVGVQVNHQLVERQPLAGVVGDLRPPQDCIDPGDELLQDVYTRQGVIFPVCLVSAAVYLFRGELSLLAALPYLAGGLVGGWIGGKLYGRVSVKWLKWLFAGFLFYAGVKYLL